MVRFFRWVSLFFEGSLTTSLERTDRTAAEESHRITFQCAVQRPFDQFTAESADVGVGMPKNYRKMQRSGCFTKNGNFCDLWGCLS